jgi:hypothetical protein
MSFLNTILSWLPFNGSKFNIGLVLTIVTIIQAVMTSADGQLLQTLISERPLNYIAIATVIIGLLHKYLKANYSATK